MNNMKTSGKIIKKGRSQGKKAKDERKKAEN